MAEPSKVRFTTISSQRHRAPSSSSVGAEMEMGTLSGALYQQLSIVLVCRVTQGPLGSHVLTLTVCQVGESGQTGGLRLTQPVQIM